MNSSPFFPEVQLLVTLGYKLQNEFSGLIAIDEVGRGCVAGPVVVCASYWRLSENRPTPLQMDWIKILGDSKKLTEKRREMCFRLVAEQFSPLPPCLGPSYWQNPYLVNPSLSFSDSMLCSPLEESRTDCLRQSSLELCNYAFGEASQDEIDAVNIWNATQWASARSLKYLQDQEKLTDDMCTNIALLMDGNLVPKVPDQIVQSPMVTAIKGDGRYKTLGFSSIMAKVFRDQKMTEIHKIFPEFGFDQHKGYGTAKHMAAIGRFGPSVIHRKSFL